MAARSHALTLREANYPPVQYIPRAEVDMTALSRTAHSTHDPRVPRVLSEPRRFDRRAVALMATPRRACRAASLGAAGAARAAAGRGGDGGAAGAAGREPNSAGAAGSAVPPVHAPAHVASERWCRREQLALPNGVPEARHALAAQQDTWPAVTLFVHGRASKYRRLARSTAA